MFLRHTYLTKPENEILKLSKSIKKNKDEIKFCHNLNLIVSKQFYLNQALITRLLQSTRYVLEQEFVKIMLTY